MSQADVHPAAAHGHDEHGHPSFVAHHFDSAQQQLDSAKLGMWVFLATEILMFGGLFCAYAVWRAHNYESFAVGHIYLDTFWGAFNTVVLIASSFTVAWAVRAIQLGQQRLCFILLALSFLGGLGFMCVKYVEYTTKFEHGMGPGVFYTAHEHAAELEEQARLAALARPDAALVTQPQNYSASTFVQWHVELLNQETGEPVLVQDVSGEQTFWLQLEDHDPQQADGLQVVPWNEVAQGGADMLRWEVTEPGQQLEPTAEFANAIKLDGAPLELKASAAAAGAQQGGGAGAGAASGSTLPKAADPPQGLVIEDDQAHLPQSSHYREGGEGEGEAAADAEAEDGHEEGAHAEHAGDHHFEYQHTPEQLLAARPFFSIYFLMTGLHGLHVLVGMGLIAWVMVKVWRGAMSPAYNTPVDLVGLYWHLVDLIWIFLFPLLYLIS